MKIEFHIFKYLSDDVELTDVTEVICCLGLFGPKSRNMIQKISSDDFSPEIFRNNKKALVAALLTFLIMIVIYKNHFNSTHINDIPGQDKFYNEITKTEIEDLPLYFETDSLSKSNNSVKQTESSQIKIAPKKDSILSTLSNNYELPKYTLKRSEPLSGSFSQIKLYITVDETIDKSLLRPLCEQITQEYSEYTNILICLYSNTDIGQDMAMGKEHNLSIEEQKEAWLVMYTYNPVEGAYYDNNPGGYLGLY